MAKMAGFPRERASRAVCGTHVVSRRTAAILGKPETIMIEILPVQRRETLGGSSSRRLRRSGLVPAILYGHGEANIPLQVDRTKLMNLIRHGHKLVRLDGDVREGAFIKDVQWDVYGKEVLHLDLLRVSETEQVRTTVAVELRGTAPGLSEGGIVEFVLHELDIQCPAAAVPEKLVVNIGGLHLGGAIHARDVSLPEGAKLLVDPDLVVVHCIAPHVKAEEAAVVAEPGAAEPELIRKEKPAAEEEE
jgi:large subunit ribosomal protein L25